MLATVQDNDGISAQFSFSDGVKYGCALTPILSSLIFSAMQTESFGDAETDICINYRSDGSMSNLEGLHVKSTVSTGSVGHLIFVYECAIEATSGAKCNTMMTTSLVLVTTSACESAHQRLK